MKLQFCEGFIQYDYTRQNDVLQQGFVPTIDNMDASSVPLGDSNDDFFHFIPVTIRILRGHGGLTKEMVRIS